MKRFSAITLLSIIFAALVTEAVKHSTNDPLYIISRSMWGARSAKKGPEDLKVKPAPYVIIHHFETEGCTSQAICHARVRLIQNYHMDHNKLDDIGYNFLVGGDANVYVGRGWGVSGAHSTNYNTKSIGICFIGNFTGRVPGRYMIEASQNLLQLGVATGRLKDNYILLGHRQTKNTACPGDNLYKLIQTWPHWSRTP